MIVQLIIFVISFLALKWYPEVGTELQRKKSRKKYITLMMVLFALQSGLRRADVGADTGQYKNFFYEDINSNWSFIIASVNDFFVYGEGKDPFYHVLVKLFGTIFPSYQLFLIFIAALFFWALGRFFYKYLNNNKEVLIACALYQTLYYSFMSITGCRQTIATAFLLFSIPYIFEKKWIKAGIFLVLAASQHKSALLFGGFYLLPFIKKSNWALLGGLALYPIMYTSGSAIALYFMQDTIFEQYADFLEQYDMVGSYFFQAYILLLGLCLLWKHKQISQTQKENYVFINAIAIAIALTPLTMIDPSNMRIVQYYSIFALIVLPMFLTSLYQEKKVSRSIFTYVFLVFFAYTMMHKFEYHFFWQ